MITEKQIRRGVHRSTEELETAIHAHIDAVNAGPKPSAGQKSAAAILAAIKRFCLETLEIASAQAQIAAISESGHSLMFAVSSSRHKNALLARERFRMAATEQGRRHDHQNDG